MWLSVGELGEDLFVRVLVGPTMGRFSKLVVVGLWPIALAGEQTQTCVDRRPAEHERTFRSRVVDEHVERIAASLEDADLACMFRNAFPNCLDTTIFRTEHSDAGVDDTFIVTGDIPAMWLRDSMNQVLPYMRYALTDPALGRLLRGLVERQTSQIRRDAYANAHNLDGSGGAVAAQHSDDQTSKPSFLDTTVTGMTPFIFERKYELDSLCAFLKLSAEYYRATSDHTPFNRDWMMAVETVVQVMTSQQSSTADDQGIYSFQRSASEPTDTLAHGKGFPAARTGLVRSAFRPSDDATQYAFLIPANAMAVVELKNVAHVLRETKHQFEYDLQEHSRHLADRMDRLAWEIDEALKREAVVMHGQRREEVYAYEVDGFGNVFHMDDANVPSLLSLPYLGYVKSSDATYLATRRVVLNNKTNPYYFEGLSGKGVGSPHTGIDQIWPMSIIMRALTSEHDHEIIECLELLKSTTGSQWVMHESFWKDDAAVFSRPWFSWANSLFGELIVRLWHDKPHLVKATIRV